MNLIELGEIVEMFDRIVNNNWRHVQNINYIQDYQISNIFLHFAQNTKIPMKLYY